MKSFVFVSKIIIIKSSAGPISPLQNLFFEPFHGSPAAFDSNFVGNSIDSIVWQNPTPVEEAVLDASRTPGQGRIYPLFMQITEQISWLDPYSMADCASQPEGAFNWFAHSSNLKLQRTPFKLLMKAPFGAVVAVINAWVKLSFVKDHLTNITV
ncbi:hypothetical protein KSP39_PZI005669 [Platanthera zijinensis]|uniref:Uncharacterized protein n=1 Tax=Platanthera zijinensis TaxID=2320716 RepID=A0AAP0BTZ1_9ASPA